MLIQNRSKNTQAAFQVEYLKLTYFYIYYDLFLNKSNIIIASI